MKIRLFHNSFPSWNTEKIYVIRFKYKPIVMHCTWNLNFDLLGNYSTKRQNPLLSVYFVNCLLYMQEIFCIIRTELTDNTAHLYCVFDDPGESYCPWNLIIFTWKFKSRRLFVVKRLNQLECDKWPLTLEIGQGQRSRSSINSMKIRLFHTPFPAWDTEKILYAIAIKYKPIVMYCR
jgi:hypothetical protein